MWKSLRKERGQATVEYVGLAVAVAVLLVSLGSGLSGQGGKLGGVVVKKLTQAIQTSS
jgi:Flp pilus assembly pilin Flp